MEQWQQYEFNYLLPKWTKELLAEHQLTSQTFFEQSLHKQPKRENTFTQSNIALEDLGKDVFQLICSRLSAKDLVSMCQVNRLWNVRFFTFLFSSLADNRLRFIYLGAFYG
jgi:hypothetical protein